MWPFWGFNGKFKVVQAALTSDSKFSFSVTHSSRSLCSVFLSFPLALGICLHGSGMSQGVEGNLNMFWALCDASGVCWESLRPYEPEDLEACSPSRTLVSMLGGLQKGHFQASPLPRRMTVFWDRACAGSAKCPHTHVPSF